MKKRLLSILLCTCMLLQLLPFSAFAAGMKKTYGNTMSETEKTGTYTALGDEITQGYTITSGQQLAYPEIVADALNYDSVHNFGKLGCTSAELIDILTNENNENHSAYLNALSASDFVTVNVGSYDLVQAIAKNMFEDAGLTVGLEDLTPEKLQECYQLISAVSAEDPDAISAAVALLSGTDLNDIQITELIQTLNDGNMKQILDDAVAEYKLNIAVIAEKLNELLEDNTAIVAVGLYNPAANLNLNFSATLSILDQEVPVSVNCNYGELITAAMEDMNKTTSTIFSSYGDKYVDISDITGISAQDPYPTAAGQQTIANRIINAYGSCLITAEAGTGGTITSSSSNIAAPGDTITFTIRADRGYSFRSLQVNGEEVTPEKIHSNTYSYTLTVEGNTTLLAKFDSDTAKYNYYTAIGDSVAAGYSLPGYTGEFSNPEGCYAHVVADELEIPNSVNLGLAALTSDNFLDIMNNEDNPYHDQFVREIQEADLLTIELGGNDINMALLDAFYHAVCGGEGALTRELRMELIIPFLENGATVENLLNMVNGWTGIDLTEENLQKISAVLTNESGKAITDGALENFRKNWAEIQKIIRKYNPDAEIVALGTYNTNSNLNIQLPDNALNLGQLFEDSIAELNEFIYNEKDTYGYKYADTKDVSLICETKVGSIDPHPTEEGHYTIAQRILDALDSREIKPAPADTIDVKPDQYYRVTAKDTNNTMNASSVQYYRVTVEDTEHGTITPGTQAVKQGEAVNFTFTPDAGYEIDDVKLDGVSVGAVTSYTISNIRANHTIKVTFKAAAAKGSCEKDSSCVYAKFTDARTTAWYHDGVHFCVENGYMNGTSAATFEPDATLSRAMVATILWNLEGKPTVNYAMSFTDVTADQWYTEAIRWAMSTGVVTGYNAQSFGPNDAVTREQLAAMLYRYAVYKGIDVSAESDLSSLADADEISSWARSNVQWAVAVGMINGRDAAHLVPAGTATRAEAATVIQRFCENVLK